MIMGPDAECQLITGTGANQRFLYDSGLRFTKPVTAFPTLDKGGRPTTMGFKPPAFATARVVQDNIGGVTDSADE